MFMGIVVVSLESVTLYSPRKLLTLMRLLIKMFTAEVY